MRLDPLLKLLTLLLSLSLTHTRTRTLTLELTPLLEKFTYKEAEAKAVAEAAAEEERQSERLLKLQSFVYVCVCVYSYVWVSGSGNPQNVEAGALLSNCICAPSVTSSPSHMRNFFSLHIHIHTIIKLLGAFVRLSIELPSCMSFRMYTHTYVSLIVCVGP